MPSHLSRRLQAHSFNTVIDQALLAPSPDHRQQVVQLAESDTIHRLAERVRKRAGLLIKYKAGKVGAILQRRDDLILHLYQSVVPSGWSCGWSDGASMTTDAHRRAAIGGILMDSDGNILENISREIGDKGAFDAELAAIAAVIRLAIELRQARLMIYTDNRGIVQLWHERRDDVRLDEIRHLGGQLERFDMHSLPRLHNQPANALAQHAIGRT